MKRLNFKKAISLTLIVIFMYEIHCFAGEKFVFDSSGSKVVKTEQTTKTQQPVVIIDYNTADEYISGSDVDYSTSDKVIYNPETGRSTAFEPVEQYETYKEPAEYNPTEYIQSTYGEEIVTTPTAVENTYEYTYPGNVTKTEVESDYAYPEGYTESGKSSKSDGSVWGTIGIVLVAIAAIVLGIIFLGGDDDSSSSSRHKRKRYSY